MEREDFTGDDPSNRTPGGGKECLGNSSTLYQKSTKRIGTHNVEANEGDQHFLTSNILHRDGGTNDGDDVFAKTHANSTDEKETATAEALNTPHSRNGHDDIDDISNNGNDEWVADSGILEESCAVVKDEVDWVIYQYLYQWRFKNIGLLPVS